MVWSKTPKQLWDHHLELESSIHLHVAYNIFNLRGEVLKQPFLSKLQTSHPLQNMSGTNG